VMNRTFLVLVPILILAVASTAAVSYHLMTPHR